MQRLSSLILNAQVNDEDIIAIYDKKGNFITKGNWYQDNILDRYDFFGKVIRVNKQTIRFQLV